MKRWTPAIGAWLLVIAMAGLAATGSASAPSPEQDPKIVINSLYELHEPISASLDVDPTGYDEVRLVWDYSDGIRSLAGSDPVTRHLWAPGGSHKIECLYLLINWEQKKALFNKTTAMFKVEGDDPNPPPPPPSDLEARVRKALELVPNPFLHLAPTFGARYREGVQLAKENSWTAKQMADYLKTALSAPPITNADLSAWAPFWPAVIEALVSEKIPSGDFDKLSSAYLAIATVLEQSK